MANKSNYSDTQYINVRPKASQPQFLNVNVGGNQYSVTKVPTPNYNQIVANGQPLPMHPYWMHWRRWTTPVGFYYYKGRENDENYRAGSVFNALGASGVAGPTPGPLSSSNFDSFVNRNESLAVAELYAQAANIDFNAAVAAAEAPKAWALIASTATRCANIFKSLKRGDVRSLKENLIGSGRHARSISRRANTARRRGGLEQFAADTWLEVKYGWKPMLYDIEGAAEAADRGWQKEPADIVIQISKRRQTDTKVVGNYADSGGATGKVTISHGYTCRVGVIQQDMRNAASLGLLNLATVAWELVPYSFVLDWLLPVGNFISAQTAFAGTAFEEGCESYHHKWKGTYTQTEYRGAPCSLNATCEGAFLQRELLSGVPNTSKILTLANADELLGWDKVVTSLALLSGAFRR
jgi:hypothetical protein